MCSTASKAFGKDHPETALAFAWVARLEAKAGNHNEACKMWTRCIESYVGWGVRSSSCRTHVPSVSPADQDQHTVSVCTLQYAR